MKASEMTNEQIADAIETAYCASSSLFGLTMREAAARLRKQPPMRFEMAFREDEKIIAALRAKLKVAEDALAKLQDRLVSSVHDGTIDPYEALKIAEDALAAIREEGDRREVSEQAITAKQMRNAYEYMVSHGRTQINLERLSGLIKTADVWDQNGRRDCFVTGDLSVEVKKVPDKDMRGLFHEAKEVEHGN